ncbi:MAG: hypothetical protein IKU67_01435 [Firmicutes bacterium]|nr:hypothetical protein [Bacillota bacterium]
MNIQGSINQLLTLAAVGVRTSPEGKKREALKENETKLKSYELQLDAMKQSEEYATEDEFKELFKQIAKIKEERFRISPSTESYGDWIESTSGYAKDKTMRKDIRAKESLYKANRRAQEALTKAQEERRNARKDAELPRINFSAFGGGE